MNVMAESTERIVEVRMPDGAVVPARIWEATTQGGVACWLYVTRVQVRADADCSQFERELQEHRVPSAETLSFPLRMVL